MLRVFFILLGLAGASREAFARSTKADDKKSPAAISKEARQRAEDFGKLMQEREREDNTREHEGQQWRAEQDRLDARRESVREAFVRTRNAHPAEDQVRLRQEADDDARQLREEKARDLVRQDFVREEREREALIEREGQIDEKREYGL